MVPHSSTLAWKIPWTEEPGRLQSMRSVRVGHDWATSLSLFTFMHWRRKWQPTPVFLPGESQGRESLMGCRLWGCTESDMTEATAAAAAAAAAAAKLNTFIHRKVNFWTYKNSGGIGNLTLYIYFCIVQIWSILIWIDWGFPRSALHNSFPFT